MQRDYASIVQPGSITVHFSNGDQFCWPSNHANFDEVREAIGAKATGDKIRELMDTVSRVKESLAPVVQEGVIRVTREGVFYKDKPIHMTVTQRIMEFVAAGMDASPQIAFLEKLLKNARREAVLSLYDFLEANRIPITEDGDFIVFKKVRHDYKDIHSGTFDNSVGQSPRVEPWEVEADRSQTCAKGLHVCSREYLPSFGSYGSGADRVVICKVNPADVVAVPRDYNNSKMRVCGYEVIGELNDQQKAEIFSTTPLVQPGDFSDSVTWGESFTRDDESYGEDSYDDYYEDDPVDEDEDDADADAGDEIGEKYYYLEDAESYPEESASTPSPEEKPVSSLSPSFFRRMLRLP